MPKMAYLAFYFYFLFFFGASFLVITTSTISLSQENFFLITEQIQSDMQSLQWAPLVHHSGTL